MCTFKEFNNKAIQLNLQDAGIYLNASSDDDGSADMESLLKFRTQMKATYDHESGLSGGLPSEQEQEKANNAYNDHVSILVDALLLVRLIILERCLIIDEAKVFTPERWMLLQSSDFADIGFGDYTSNNEKRPVLSPILRSLRHVSVTDDDYCVIPCGTGLSHYDLEWVMQSGKISKEDLSVVKTPLEDRVIDFPGCECKESIKKFIEYIGEWLGGDALEVLNDLLPPKAIGQLFRRLRGRFRPIVMVIELVMKEATKDRCEVMENATLQEKDRFPGCLDMLGIVKMAIVNMRTVGVVLELSGGVPRLVEASIGRLHCLRSRKGIKNAVTTTITSSTDEVIRHPSVTTVIDEPFVYDGAVNYFKHTDPNFLQHFETHVASIPDASVKGCLWEQVIPWMLIRILHGKKLEDLKDISGRKQNR
ncbi:hypothetical protein BGZ65_003499 [Modicella reniformis]|uniref:Uncharacterized protein n=1 Tax=Modicella reniformis TaxID=1440133 RepID=A0A9P6M993_9FUNG|nr:hypothetical protein BGZ65_003499 [Modicella reniformis]